MIEALSSNRSDQSFHVRILPRTPWRGQYLVDLHSFKTGPKGWPVGAVSIPQQEPGRRVPGERVADLLGRPLGRGVPGHVDMEDLTAVVGEHDEDPQDPECERWNDEEVDRGELADMIVEEGAPGLRRWRTTTHQVLATVDSAISMLSLSSSPWIRGAPQVGFARHISRMSARTARGIRGRPGPRRRLFPSPGESKPASVPSEDRFGLDDDERPAPSGP